MSGELDVLWALGGVDEHRIAARATLARLPATRLALERKVAEERARLTALAEQLAQLQLARRGLERDIEAVEQQARKFEGQLPAVKKNEEYQALLHEIAGCKAKRSEIETGVLESMEREEALAAGRPAMEKAVSLAESERAAQTATLDREQSATEASLATLEQEAAGLLDRLPAPTRARYERIRASRDGRAVVPIQKGACGGCFRALPPQVLQEAKRHDRILSCEGCGRILILPPEG